MWWMFVISWFTCLFWETAFAVSWLSWTWKVNFFERVIFAGFFVCMALPLATASPQRLHRLCFSPFCWIGYLENRSLSQFWKPLAFVRFHAHHVCIVETLAQHFGVGKRWPRARWTWWRWCVWRCWCDHEALNGWGAQAVSVHLTFSLKLTGICFRIPLIPKSPYY